VAEATFFERLGVDERDYPAEQYLEDVGEGLVFEDRWGGVFGFCSGSGEVWGSGADSLIGVVLWRGSLTSVAG
jgi:hypothetical protein